MSDFFRQGPSGPLKATALRSVVLRQDVSTSLAPVGSQALAVVPGARVTISLPSQAASGFLQYHLNGGASTTAGVGRIGLILAPPGITLPVAGLAPANAVYPLEALRNVGFPGASVVPFFAGGLLRVAQSGTFTLSAGFSSDGASVVNLRPLSLPGAGENLILSARWIRTAELTP